MNVPAAPANLRDAIARLTGDAALAALLVLVVARCLVMFSSVTLFGVSLQPVEQLHTSIGPVGTAVADSLAVATLGLALVRGLLSRKRLCVTVLWLWLIGAGFVCSHAIDSAEAMRIGGNWLGATALGVAAMHLAADPRYRRTILAALVGLIVALALTAVYEVAVQHARDVAYYQQTKDELLVARGWEPDSMAARKYERRLMQNEATGQFGMANVFGSVMITLALVAGGFALAAGKQRRVMPVCSGLVLAALGAAALTFGKGAAGAAIVAAGAMGCAWLGDRFVKRGVSWWRGAALGAVALAVAVVIVRGAVVGPPPTEQGERSLLFRWFYWQGAARMLVDHPVAGVGPGLFKDAYLTAKPPISPEEVSDPHNVFAAFVSMLGVGGLAWSVMLVMWLWRAARLPWHDRQGQGEPPSHSGAPSSAHRGPMDARCGTHVENKSHRRRRIAIAVVVTVGAFGFQYAMHYPMLLPETVGMWLIGMLSFGLLTAWLPGQHLNERLLSIGLLTAATAALVHSQIEIAMTHAMAGPLLMVVLGTAGAKQEDHAPGKRWPAAIMPALLVAVLGIMVWGTASLAHSESELRVAQRLYASGRPADAARVLEELPEPRFTAASAYARFAAWQQARSVGDSDSAASLEQGLRDQIAGFFSHRAHLSQLLRTGVQISAEMARQTGDPRWSDFSGTLAHALLHADPYSVPSRLLAADTYWQQGERAMARIAYAEALKLNDAMYLDSLSQLPERDLERAKARSSSDE